MALPLPYPGRGNMNGEWRLKASVWFCCDKWGFVGMTGDLIRHGYAVPPSPEGKAFGFRVSQFLDFPSGEGGRSEAEVG